MKTNIDYKTNKFVVRYSASISSCDVCIELYEFAAATALLSCGTTKLEITMIQ